MAKPTTLEELRQWVANHVNDGIIDRESTIPEGRAEFRHGIVSGDLYDRALLISAPFGYSKSEIAVIGASNLLANSIIDGAKVGLIAPVDIKEGTEFRANLPQGLYDLIQSAKSDLGWSNSQMMTMILAYFSYDPGNEKIYRQWVTKFVERHSCTVEQVEAAIYDRRRYQARVKRLEMSERAGHLISDRKIAT